MLSKSRRIAVAISIISGLSMIAVAADKATDEAPSTSGKTAAVEKPKTQKKEKVVAANADKLDKPDKTAKVDKKDLAPVLEPSQFYGAAAMGYAAAKACPEVQAKLFCYCGCDVTDKHTSLLDCFTSYHGVDCHICQEEAVLALKMHREGATIAQIQEKVDQTYSAQYPFTKDTDTLTQYKATRLWKQTSDQPGATTETPAGGTDAKAGEKPKLKRGATVGECCGAHHPKEKKKK